MKIYEQNRDSAQLDDEIRRFEVGRIALPRFTPELEARYQRDTSVERLRLLLSLGTVTLLAYDFFVVGDFFMAPEHITRAVVVRFGIFTPLVLLSTLLVRHSRRVRNRELLPSLLCLLAVACTLYLHYNMNALVSAEAQMELALVLLSANCLLRIDLPYAFGTSLVAIGMDLLFLQADHLLTNSHKLVSLGMLGWMFVLTLTANFALSRESRLTYLLQLRGRMQRGQLAEANAELLALSSTDRLTGLPNRRAYDVRLSELWRICHETHDYLSAVMVDVDHFKRLNDTHGHPYGDRVLQRIATLMQQAMRGETDFVARYGGEEFVVLLPNADSDSAHKVAERIRTLVQVAGSPAVQRDSPVILQDVWATVSCGVATTRPGAGGDPSRLIAEADAALYRAKQEGRNRVMIAAPRSSMSKIRIFPGTMARN